MSDADFDFGENDDPSCGRCGSSMSWEECHECDEFGYSYHDDGEDCCCCEFPENNVVCDLCDGNGGWYTCLSSSEWCQANPLPGCENAKHSSVIEGE